ncbi:MAG: PQQ-dependent sugar dehydrogenase [Labilithrix sp.]|nr:PQQ-dependent sugar dehydrogenase [Labilithrix sp.]MCW5813227.1 PQQ-dependent sugar dehydrogenase [Labilithrix sp.]
MFRARLFIILGCVVGAWAAACSGDDPAPAASTPAGPDGASGPDGAGGPDGTGANEAGTDSPDAPPTRAEIGLDVRPANATCKAPPRPASTGSAKLERVFSSVTITRPMALVQPPGDPSRWFLAQRNGVIRSFSAANPPATPPEVVSVSALAGKAIREELEGGFLNFQFHPKFAENGRAYVSFTTDSTTPGMFRSEVGYLTSTDNGATFTSYTTVLSFDRPRLEHNGGGMAFGKDGYLYLGFGDGANDDNAQNKENLFGKIVRIDVDNTSNGEPYGIPPTNPFANGGGRPEIFAYGLRNPFRISIDRSTGELWAGDVGHARWEEINKVELGGNYGWPCREGKHDHLVANPIACPSTSGLTDPVVEHEHPTPNSRSITGGVVYRGAAIPGFQGTYVYADFIQLEAWALSFEAATGEAMTVRINELGPSAGFSTFTEDANGEIYVLALFQDSVFKLVPGETPDAGAPAAPFPELLSQTGCVDPADPKKPAAGLVPYGVNAQLWSDGAEKERFIALPDGQSITAMPDGDLDLPIGSVLVKTFRMGGKLIETRLFVHHEDGDWGGYSYEWNEAETDATLLASGKTKPLDAERSWSFPSRSDCMRCHTVGAGRTLGLELGQLDGDFVYATTGRIANQIKTLEHIGALAPTGKTIDEIIEYPDPFGAAPLEARSRAYLHANCGGCHRPQGGAARSSLDLRFSTAPADMKACGEAPLLDDLGLAGAKLVAPGSPETSVLSRRMHAVDARRMPPLARNLVDERGTTLIDDWIRAKTGCP